jgi:hypothetical protein
VTVHPSLTCTAAALAVTTLASAVLTAVPAAAAPPQWTVVPAPSIGSPSLLTGVTALSRTNVWAVGRVGDWWNVRPQALQWDGTYWRPTHVPIDSTGVLNGVDATYSGSAYAVGSADSQRRTFVTRWRAGAWSTLPSPSPGVGAHELKAVTMLSDWDGWAVGGYNATAGGADHDNLILRWNGVSWNQVPVPNAGAGINMLTGVTATGPNSALAVGYLTWPGQGVPRETVILRWDGVSWKRVPSPNLSSPAAGGQNMLNAVTAVSPTEAWAVGFTASQGWSARRPVAMRWNGGAWIPVPTPPIAEALEYTGVAAVSSSRVYFAGYQGRFLDQNMLVRWDGARLVAESVAEPATGLAAMTPIGSALTAVTAVPSGEAWAVGHLGNTQNRVLARAAGAQVRP